MHVIIPVKSKSKCLSRNGCRMRHFSSQSLELTLSKLRSTNETLGLLLEDRLDLAGVLLTVELAGDGSQFLVVHLDNKKIDVVESGVDLGSGRIAGTVTRPLTVRRISGITESGIRLKPM